jgi:hypothetical protein
MGMATLAFATEEAGADRVGGGAPVVFTAAGLITLAWLLLASWVMARFGRHVTGKSVP